MRYILILGILSLAGCTTPSGSGVVGPFAPRSPARVDDPRYSIPEQESRGRDRYAIPEMDNKVAPPSGYVLPGVSTQGDR